MIICVFVCVSMFVNACVCTRVFMCAGVACMCGICVLYIVLVSDVSADVNVYVHA